MPFDINSILTQATEANDTAENERVAAAVADRLAKLDAALKERISEVTKYEAKKAKFMEEIGSAATAADALKVVGKQAYTVRFLHLND